MQVYLEKIGLKHESEYLSACRANRENLQPWVKVAWTKKQFINLIRETSTVNDRAYLVRRISDKSLIGVIEIRDIFMGYFKCGYLMYYAFEGFKGRGYMKEALQLAIHRAFSKFKLHRLEANIQPNNLASKGLAKAVGMSYEGYSPKFLKMNGAWRDHERWAILSGLD